MADVPLRLPALPSARAWVNPDSRTVLAVTILVTVTIGVTSFIQSYTGLVAVALWAAVPAWLTWAVPVTVDGAILLYTLALLVFRARGESARVAWVSLMAFTALSVTANAAHAWDIGVVTGVQLSLGMFIAGVAPIAVLLCTHTLARLIVAPPAARTDVATVPEPGQARTAAKPVPELVQLDRPARPAMTRPAPVQSSEDRDAQIRELARQDLSSRTIAERLGISKTTVIRVLNKPVDEAQPATV